MRKSRAPRSVPVQYPLVLSPGDIFFGGFVRARRGRERCRRLRRRGAAPPGARASSARRPLPQPCAPPAAPRLPASSRSWPTWLPGSRCVGGARCGRAVRRATPAARARARSRARARLAATSHVAGPLRRPRRAQANHANDIIMPVAKVRGGSYRSPARRPRAARLRARPPPAARARAVAVTLRRARSTPCTATAAATGVCDLPRAPRTHAARARTHARCLPFPTAALLPLRPRASLQRGPSLTRWTRRPMSTTASCCRSCAWWMSTRPSRRRRSRRGSRC